MKIYRNQRKQPGRVRATASVPATSSVDGPPGPDPLDVAQPAGWEPRTPEKKRAHTSFFDGLDTAARTFLGPADRTDGERPVIHLHDAAEDLADATFSSIDVYTDSSGHHYAQRKTPVHRPTAE
jgi:hypothetical protein